MATKQNFQTAYQELEKIVHDFETKELDLEQDMPKFEQGMKLVKQLKQQLGTMKNKVEEIEQKFDD